MVNEAILEWSQGSPPSQIAALVVGLSLLHRTSRRLNGPNDECPSISFGPTCLHRFEESYDILEFHLHQSRTEDLMEQCFSGGS